LCAVAKIHHECDQRCVGDELQRPQREPAYHNRDYQRHERHDEQAEQGTTTTRGGQGRGRLAGHRRAGAARAVRHRGAGHVVLVISGPHGVSLLRLRCLAARQRAHRRREAFNRSGFLDLIMPLEPHRDEDDRPQRDQSKEDRGAHRCTCRWVASIAL